MIGGFGCAFRVGDDEASADGEVDFADEELSALIEGGEAQCHWDAAFLLRAEASGRGGRAGLSAR